jgi:hypothetical protein
VNILQNHKELSANKITNPSLNSCPNQTFINGKIGLASKLSNSSPDPLKRGNLTPNKIFGNTEKYSPLEADLNKI